MPLQQEIERRQIIETSPDTVSYTHLDVYKRQLPNDVDEDLVNRLYVEAWKSGCKGCTVYRDGSRSGVPVSYTHLFHVFFVCYNVSTQR